MTGTYEAEHWSQAEPSLESLARYRAANMTPYNHAKFTAFMRLLPQDMRGLRVLDYGGGGGWVSVHCAKRGASVTLVDAAPNALRLSWMLAASMGVSSRLTTICSEHVPGQLKHRDFDVVIAKDVVEHIDNDSGFAADLAACTKSGGQLLLSTHNRWSLTWLIEGAYHRLWLHERGWCGWDPTHVRFYSPRSLRRLLRAAGFHADAWRGVYVVPYDIMTWLLLMRKQVFWGWLSGFDASWGELFPFNRVGWNVVLSATRSTRQ